MRLQGGAAALVVALLATVARGQDSTPSLDPIQQAVVDSLDASLALPGGETPAALLDAAIRAADAEAVAAAEGYLVRLATLADKAGAAGPDLLADLADGSDEAALARLDRAVRLRQPAGSRLVRGILEAGRLRRRDPGMLARMVAGLDDPDLRARREAVAGLARAGIDALPAVVPLLDPAAPGGRRQDLARGLVARLGQDARQPLLDWLGNAEPAEWAAVIEALRAADPDDVEAFLLAPAVVPGTPPDAQAAARRFLEARVSARGQGGVVVPSPPAAATTLATRLDRLLAPEGLPPVDHLQFEPVVDPARAAAALGGGLAGSVERRFWNPQAKAFERVAAAPRVARAREAMHLARDLQALGVDDPAAIDLVLLARLEALLVTGGDPLTVLERVPPQAVREALAGPAGFSAELAGRVFEQAVERGMWQAAAAAAAALVPEGKPAFGLAGSPGTLPPDVREALACGLAVPDLSLQFAAARALVLAAGDPP